MKSKFALWAAALLVTSAFAGAHLTDGEVRKVDKETKKITLRHGPIKSLEMPAMTMVFQVSDPALLDKVKPGDKVLFAAKNDGGKMTVTQIEAAK
jgi:Cu(I)/Ag(I) efflux system protein CusF